MKNAIALFAAVVVLTGGASLYAGEAAPATPPADTKPMCCQFLKQTDLLNKKQKLQAGSLHDQCLKQKCSPAAQAEFFKQVKLMLSPEQIAQCKVNCEKAKITGCPICSDAKPKS